MIIAIETFIVWILMQFFTVDQINAVLGDPRSVAIIVGILVSVSASVLGVFLVLRKMSMVSDAISHTVLLGIILAVLVMLYVFGMDFDLSSPWLLIGAAGAGVATIGLTELIINSGLVKEDASLGLAFPFLFAVAIILLSLFVDNVHLDGDAVMVGEIGVAWANTNSHCFDNCDDVTITPDDPRAETGRQCINCIDGVSPRSPEAVFEDVCSNCGTFTAAQAWQQRLIDTPPTLVFIPKAITVLLIVTLLNVLFVTLLFKELKITTFDPGLAATLGFSPGLIRYLLMILVSLTAVAAFDAVGSILVIAFFVVPAATLYLLTDRLSIMLFASPLVGIAAAFTGYEFSRGSLFGLNMSNVLVGLDSLIGLGGYTDWNTSISASMVMMLGLFFIIAWIFSPRYGLVALMIQRGLQYLHFADNLLLGHVYNHEGTPQAYEELRVDTLHEHLRWTPIKVNNSLRRLRLSNSVIVKDGLVHLTERGTNRVESFRKDMLHTVTLRQGRAVGD